MLKTKSKSESIFDHLRVLEFSDGEARRDYNLTNIYKADDSAIEIFTAEIMPGRCAWGYNIFGKDGGSAFRFPSLEYGYCRSERDAKLYILGLLLANASMFSNYAKEAIGVAIRNIQQLNLF